MRIAALLLLTSAAAAQDAERGFEAQLAAIVPAVDESAWRAVPWQTELRAALVAANAARKPVLLWAMNGHPLGQT